MHIEVFLSYASNPGNRVTTTYHIEGIGGDDGSDLHSQRMNGYRRSALHCRSFGVIAPLITRVGVRGLSGVPTRQPEFANMRVSLIPSDIPAEQKRFHSKSKSHI